MTDISRTVMSKLWGTLLHYPLRFVALTRANLAANTLASAVACLPLTLPNIVQDAGLA